MVFSFYKTSVHKNKQYLNEEELKTYRYCKRTSNVCFRFIQVIAIYCLWFYTLYRYWVLWQVAIISALTFVMCSWTSFNCLLLWDTFMFKFDDSSRKPVAVILGKIKIAFHFFHILVQLLHFELFTSALPSLIILIFIINLNNNKDFKWFLSLRSWSQLKEFVLDPGWLMLWNI